MKSRDSCPYYCNNNKSIECMAIRRKDLHGKEIAHPTTTINEINKIQ